MLFEVVVLRDISANCYGQPTFTPRLGLAIRSFSDEVNREDANNVLNKHPDDFELYHIGTFDDSTAELKTFSSPVQIAVGKHLVRKFNKE